KGWNDWLPADQLMPFAPAPPNAHYVIFGWPHAQVRYHYDEPKVFFQGRYIPTLSLRKPFLFFGGPCALEDYAKLDRDPHLHIALKFPREKTFNPYGERTTAPSPRGASGGALIWAPATLPASESRLAGIFMEWPHPKPFLTSTRIEAHLHLIQ